MFLGCREPGDLVDFKRSARDVRFPSCEHIKFSEGTNMEIQPHRILGLICCPALEESALILQIKINAAAKTPIQPYFPSLLLLETVK